MMNTLGAPQMLDHELSDLNWRKYFDRLKAAGVSKLSTAEAKGMNDPYSKLQEPVVPGGIRTRQPGFFDTQGMNPAQQESLKALMKAGLL